MYKRMLAMLFLLLLVACHDNTPVAPNPILPERPHWKVKEPNPQLTLVEAGPVVVYGGDEALVLRDSYFLRGKRDKLLKEVWVFQGVDRGDIVEMNTFIYDGSTPMVLVDRHKETISDESAYTKWEVNRKIKYDILIDIVCRVNGKNIFLKNRLAARPHWGVQFIWE